MVRRVRAIILQGKELVVIKREKPDDLYWVFPGGGVEEYDADLKSALIRECQEELGVKVIVGDLFCEQMYGEQMEYFFICSIESGELGTGDGPEFQEGNAYIGTHVVERRKIEEIKYLNLKPRKVRDDLITFLRKIQ